ncbi:hypothetical protein [Mycolicibacter longobardus]|uniref:UsfY protein n=1 Tax=Mycolicibacter longobardus TaxID=1108812 RepID=A0A1X1Y7F0_9MYCO|nr:hypothetical protein [Mycolicibacter longobardus]MCV7383683.1 hypothetical protein [Mycolicibacter longobardus]ORW06989.1 hypothetical protein AWC16_22355 [Mycolicibacter longobardus]
MSNTDEGIDYKRTTRPRDGLVFKDRRELPGLAMLMMAALALVGFMSAAALHDATWTLGFGIAVLALAAGGLTWIFVGRRRTTHADHHRRQA